MSNLQEFRKVYYVCIKQLIDANVDLLRKANFSNEISFKSELEIALYTFAYFSNKNLYKPNHDNDEIFEETMIESLRWMFSQKLYEFSDDYFRDRLSEFKCDINICTSNKSALPTYTYYSIFKSPLKHFEIEKVNDYNIIELLKFKSVMLHLSDMNEKPSEYLYATLKSILNQS